jgi:hypothetical protein
VNAILLRQSLLVMALTIATGLAQEPRRPATRTSTVTGVLVGATSNHDGSADWIAFVAGESATYLIVYTGKDYGDLKKLLNKRVAVQGEAVTEMTHDGKKVQLAGAVGSIHYQGNLSIQSLANVQLQAVTELTGTVQEVEQPAEGQAKDRQPAKVLQLRSEDEKVVHGASAEAAKKLKEHVGKLVRVRAYVAGDRIEAIDSVAAVTPSK